MAAPSYILVVNPSVPVKNAADIIAYAKANPGKLTYGSSGVGTASHLSGALFGQMAGVDLLHVPYRGTGPAVNDLLGGQINMLFSPPQVVTQHIAVGKLRMIGTTGAERSALFPDFPTIAETGLPNYSSLGWFGLFAPAKTPAAIVSKISADTAQGARARRRREAADRGRRGAGGECARRVHEVRQPGHRQVARPRPEGEYQAEAVRFSMHP